MNPEQYLERLRSDPCFFTYEVWDELGLLQHHPITDVMEDMIRFGFTGIPDYDPAVHFNGGDIVPEFPKRGLLAPRGDGKTYLIVCTGACWDLFRDPLCNLKVVSKSHGHAVNIVSQIRQWIGQVGTLQHLEPNKALRHRDSEDQFDTGPATRRKDPSLDAKGIDGQITGTRAHKVYWDDVETMQNTRTLAARELLSETVKEGTEIASFGRKEQVYVGTYHHEESLYTELPKRGFEFRTWPIAYPQTTDRIHNLAPLIRGRLESGEAKHTQDGAYHLNPVDTVKYDAPTILNKMAEGRTHFAMQNMLIADLGDELRYPLRLRDLVVPTFMVERNTAPLSIKWGEATNAGSTKWEEIESLGFGVDALYKQILFNQEEAPYTGTVMFIDTSGAGADETAYAIVGHLAGYLWCKAVGGLARSESGHSDAVRAELMQLARQHGVRTILVEENMNSAFAPLLEVTAKQYFVEPGDQAFPDGWRCGIEPIRSKGQKELRIIDALEPVMNAHRLIIDRRAIEPEPGVDDKYQLQYQMTRITRQRDCLVHDDRLDALAGAVAHWRDLMHVDPKVSEERRLEGIIDDRLREHRAQMHNLSTGNQKPRMFRHR